MNTAVEYRYVDADNYKTFRTIVLKGQMTGDHIAIVLACCVGLSDFLPLQVGLEPLQCELQAMDVNDNRNSDGAYDPFGEDGADHVWHDFPEAAESFFEVDSPPTADMSPMDFVMSFVRAKGDWSVKEELAKLNSPLEDIRAVFKSIRF